MRAPGQLMIGYTSREHLLLDLDNSSKKKARALSQMIMREFPEVGDCMIMQSSEGNNRLFPYAHPTSSYPYFFERNNFMLVFDNKIPYDLSLRIIQLLAHLNIVQETYSKIRFWRGDMTLRVTPKAYSWETRPKPEFVDYIINNYSNTRNYLAGDFIRFLEIANNAVNNWHINYPESSS